MVEGVDDRIVILDIDEKSLAEFGQWPWNRTRIATIVDTLFDKYGIKGARKKFGNDLLKSVYTQ